MNCLLIYHSTLFKWPGRISLLDCWSKFALHKIMKVRWLIWHNQLAVPWGMWSPIESIPHPDGMLRSSPADPGMHEEKSFLRHPSDSGDSLRIRHILLLGPCKAKGYRGLHNCESMRHENMEQCPWEGIPVY